jgi:hypothetical protein
MSKLSIEDRLDALTLGWQSVICKPFDFTSPIPPRKLIEINGCKSYAQGFLSVTGAAGGTGKSSLAIVEELSLAIGYDLFLPQRPALKCGRKRVWSMSLEDDETEHRRRVTAAMRHYAIEPEQVGENYWVTYKADSPIEVGTLDRSHGFMVSPQVEQIKTTVRAQGIDVINIDPFVNTHSVSENDNGAMNKVADLWRSIAQECGTAIGLTHHIRKGGNGHEVGAEDLRGAVSLTSAARLVRVLAPMSTEEADNFSISHDRRRFYFWVNPYGKSNITPPNKSRVWYQMASFDFNNGTDEWDNDSVGVAESWNVPDSLEGVTGCHVEELSRKLLNATDEYLLTNCRKDVQAKGSWIGYLIAEIVGLDADDRMEQNKIKGIVQEWLRAKVLEIIRIKSADRKEKPCLRLGSATQSILNLRTSHQPLEDIL